VARYPQPSGCHISACCQTALGTSSPEHRLMDQLASTIRGPNTLLALALLALNVTACSGSEGNSSDPGSAGGSTDAAGGIATTGGALGSGGALQGQGGRATGGAVSAGGTAAGGAMSSSAPTWTQLWTNYFQPQCASCHQSSATVGSRMVYSTAAQLCTFLTSQRQLNGTTTPPLVSASQSVLVWFNPAGSMPEGVPTPPANAVNDIKAWATAGAACP
jgi:hypothetical protein